MDMPLDHRIFDPPPKQHAQSTSATTNQQLLHYLHLNNQQHHHNSSTVSTTNLPRISFAKNNQNEPSEVCSTRISQSGSYVEILKHTKYQNLQSDNNQRQNFSINEDPLTKSDAVNSHLSSSSCQNKSYGNFLTITPRRKGKLLSTAAAIGDHRYHHNIEPLNLLSVEKDNNATIKSTKLYDYKTLETLSKADTLLLGSTIFPKLKKTYCAEITTFAASDKSFENGSNTTNQSSNICEFQQILLDTNLSPPTAFSDGAKKSSLS